MKRILTEDEYQDITKESKRAVEKLDGLLDSAGYMEVYWHGEYGVSSLQFLKSEEIVDKMDQSLKEKLRESSEDYKDLRKNYNELKETNHKLIVELSEIKGSMSIWSIITSLFKKS